MKKRLNPLNLLARPDKWYLGGGNRLLWAPQFPVWLGYPGFWDKASYYNFDIEPVFTWTILDGEGRELPLRVGGRTWDPSKLTSSLQMQDPGPQIPAPGRVREDARSRLALSEEKCCLPGDILASVVRIRNRSSRRIRLHFIAWTTQPSYPSRESLWLTDTGYRKGKAQFTRHIQRPGAPPVRIFCSLAFDRPPSSYCVQLSEGSAVQPHWKLTPFAEKFQDGSLPDEIRLGGGVSPDGLVHIALHTELDLGAKTEEKLTVLFSAASSPPRISPDIRAARHSDPLRVSRQAWTDHFAAVPSFRCSDEFLERYYYYRWYGLRLNTIRGREGHYRHPAVCEGIGDFRAPISYSAPCHMLESRWMHDPALAQGSLLTFIENQRDDGGFRGYIDPFSYRQEMFYHANWGKALRELHALHPDTAFLRKVYPGLRNYAAYFDRERDAEGSGLYDIDNHSETGQEYMSRYTAVDPGADQEDWGKVFRLKGVDSTVYLYELKRALSWAAGVLGNPRESERLAAEAGAIQAAIGALMWDAGREMFFDVDARSGARTMVKAATCFYPYMTDLVSPGHLPGLARHLLNPKEFWTPFPVPSSALDDEEFSSEAEWKGKRMNCPWNGRVWPMTNSHMAEALAQSAIRFKNVALRKRSAELITRFIRMMFAPRGGASMPNCFEHYNPFSGAPSLYRGVDDYQHSWVVDLIIKYVAGVRPEEKRVVVDPFPFPAESVTVDDILVQGRSLRVEREGSSVRVWLDGKAAGESRLGRAQIIPLSSSSSSS